MTSVGLAVVEQEVVAALSRRRLGFGALEDLDVRQLRLFLALGACDRVLVGVGLAGLSKAGRLTTALVVLVDLAIFTLDKMMTETKLLMLATQHGCLCAILMLNDVLNPGNIGINSL